MEDNRITLGFITIDNFTEGILYSPNTTGYRQKICKLSGKIQCRDATITESRGVPGLLTCFIEKNKNILSVYTDVYDLNIDGQNFTKETLSGDVFGLLHRAHDTKDWHLGAIFDEDFYRNLNVQECFKDENVSIQEISSGQIVHQSSIQNYFLLFIPLFVIFIIVILILLVFIHKRKRKSL